MEALGQLTGGVAHDFNNLLAVIISNLEIVEAKLEGNAPLQEHLHDASAAALRAASLTQRLLSLSRKQALKPQPIETAELLEEIRLLLGRTLGETIRVTIEGCEGLRPCVADRSQLESAILNLTVNARDAMRDGGEIVIRGSNVDLNETHAAEHPESQPGSYIQICVSDSGSGIPAKLLPRVFEPFFTTKEVGAGTGLGLSMVYGFAKQSGGHLEIESEEGTGTKVRLYLPSNGETQWPLEPEEEPDTPMGRGETVLVVEDEPAVRKLVIMLLDELGYQVVGAAADGSEAIGLLGEIESLDLLLSDVVLPGGRSGADLAKEIGLQRPDTRVLLMSGYAPESAMAAAQLEPGIETLQKPFRTGDLARAIRAALDV
jgi:CheY-like chemotaxis protein